MRIWFLTKFVVELLNLNQMKRTALAALAGAAIFASCSPTEYEVSRDITIDAQPEVVYEQVVNHKNRDAWSPWEKMDPNMTKSYEGPEAGVGAIYNWSGNDSVGTGSLEILEAREYDMIKSSLTFTSPWESTSEVIWSFEEIDGGTKATWMVKGELPGYLFWMGQEEMDENMGPDFQRGLESLKKLAESKKPEQKMTAELVEVKSMPYYFIRNEVSFDDMDSEFFSDRYGAISDYLAADMQNMIGPSFAIYHKWDEEAQMTDVEVAMPCKSSKSGTRRIKKGKTYAGKALKSSYKGSYDLSKDVHEFLNAEIAKKGMDYNGSCWEVYVVGAYDTDNPDEYVTEIYYPVKPKAAS